MTGFRPSPEKASSLICVLPRHTSPIAVAFASTAASASGTRPDNSILSTVMALQSERPDATVILVSKDINLRIKAAILGVPAEDYYNDRALDDLSGTESVAFPLRARDGRDFLIEAGLVQVATTLAGIGLAQLINPHSVQLSPLGLFFDLIQIADVIQGLISKTFGIGPLGPMLFTDLNDLDKFAP